MVWQRWPSGNWGLILDELQGNIAKQASEMGDRIAGLETRIGKLSADIMDILNTPVQRLMLRISGKRLPDIDEIPDRQ